jgi:hypothetical protein
MPIINKYESYYLDSEKAPVKVDKTFLDIFYDFSDKSYWLVSCFDGKALRHFNDVVPNHILHEIRNNNIILCIGAEHEAFIDIPETIYDFLIQELSIPAESILLLSANAKIDVVVDNIASVRNLPKIKSKWICVFERGVSVSPSSVLDTLQLKEYPKKFLSLNRRWRGCKLSLISHLKMRNLLEHGFVSLQAFEGKTWDNSWEYMIQLQDSTTKELFERRKDEIINLPNLILDDMNPEEMNPVTNTLDHYYLNSYFSVVGGAIFYEKELPNVAGLCEKTFKAMQKKHPFILLSTGKNLPLLHSMGYKTFDGLIDESYDNETDDNKRMQMIVNEIERLCNLNQVELETFLVEVKKIVEHNFKNLYYRAYLPRVYKHKESA